MVANIKGNFGQTGSLTIEDMQAMGRQSSTLTAQADAAVARIREKHEQDGTGPSDIIMHFEPDALGG